MAEIMDREKAIAEIREIMAAEKMRPSKIKRLESIPAVFDTLVDGLMDGSMLPDLANGKIVQKLCFPLGDNKSVTELTFNTRVPMKSLNDAYAKINSADGAAKINATIETMTGIFGMQVLALRPTDKELADAIAVFFM